LSRTNTPSQVYRKAMRRLTARYNKNLPKDSLGRMVLSSHLLMNQAGMPPITINNKTMGGGKIIAGLYSAKTYKVFSSD